MSVKSIKKDTGLESFDWTLNGRLRTDVDPMLIGETNFCSLINMRPTNDGIKGIAGMQKINSNTMSSRQIVNGYHFRKNVPAESHVFVHGASAPLEDGVQDTSLFVSNNTSDVPGNDEFHEFKTLQSSDTINFGDAPDGAMTVMNGTDSLIWGGNESSVAYYANFDKYDDPVFWYNYTDVVSNTLSDPDNVAYFRSVFDYLGSVGETNTISDSEGYEYLLHFDDTPFIDSSEYNRVVQTIGTVGCIYSTNSNFGKCAKFIGDGSTVRCTDPELLSVFYGIGKKWTIELRVLLAGSPMYSYVFILFEGNYGQSFKFTLDNDMGGESHLDVSINAYSQSPPYKILAISTKVKGLSSFPNENWYYFAISGESYLNNGIEEAAIWVHYGAEGGITTCTETEVSNGEGSGFIIPYFQQLNIGTEYNGILDEFKISNFNKYKPGELFPVPPRPEPPGPNIKTISKVLIGSSRPLQGVKWYIKVANVNTGSSVSMKIYNGGQWINYDVTDGTSVNGVTLAKTGEVSFSSTIKKCVPQFINNLFAYYYEFSFINLAPETSIYYCTVNYEMQVISDIWDGTLRPVSMFLFFKDNIGTCIPTDLTFNVLTRDYDANSPWTYANIGNMDKQGGLVFGFTEKIIGLYLSFPDTQHVNINNCEISVYYYTGYSWERVSVQDGTYYNKITCSRSGFISWYPLPGSPSEFKTTILNKIENYYYRVRITGDPMLSSDVRLDYVAGISAPKEIYPHKFSIMWQDRLWLCNDPAQNPSYATCSAWSTNCVFNGDDSATLIFGDDEELTCGTTLYSRFGNSIYDNMIMFKSDSMYLVDGSGPDTWTVYTVSDNIGCIAPLTLQKCDVSYSVSEDVQKHIVVWRSTRGIEIFDGNTVVPISRDINSFFDSTMGDYIDPVLYDVSKEISWYDNEFMEYHWCFMNADGNRELVYSVIFKKWFEVSRGERLTCGFPVSSPSGVRYSYGGTGDGYVERLEFSNNFDGTKIPCSFRTGDVLLSHSGNYVTKLRHIKLLAKSKSLPSEVSVTHYADTAEGGTKLINVPQNVNGYRIYQNKTSVNIDAVMHGLKFYTAESVDIPSFEPMLISGLYQIVREDI